MNLVCNSTVLDIHIDKLDLQSECSGVISTLTLTNTMPQLQNSSQMRAMYYIICVIKLLPTGYLLSLFRVLLEGGMFKGDYTGRQLRMTCSSINTKM